MVYAGFPRRFALPHPGTNRTATAGFPRPLKTALPLRNAVDVLPEGALERRLAEAEAAGRPLRVKLGVDPTAAHDDVLRSADADESWAPLFTNTPPTAVTNSLLDAWSGAKRFYRVKAQR